MLNTVKNTVKNKNFALVINIQIPHLSNENISNKINKKRIIIRT